MRDPVRILMMLAWMTTIALAGSSARAQDFGPPRLPDGEIDGPNPGPGIRNACSETALAARNACQGEMEDDYWIAVGKCQNLGDARERKSCLAEALAARTEAEALCQAQLVAREEVCGLLGQAPYDPTIRRGDFLSAAQAAASPHPYFPLVPGTTWHYVNGSETIDIMVTDQTVEILGVECLAVRDVARENGEIIEDTTDWYAMDKDGNVWYFGEHSETWEAGELVNLDGTWKAGVDGGKAGIIMWASPTVDMVYRQEFLLGEAEDLARVLSTTASEQVPAAACDGDCLETHDFTPIEPGSGGDKYYAAGVGLMLEVDPETGAREELTGFQPGGGTPSGAAVNESGDTDLIRRPPSRRLLSPVRVEAHTGSQASGGESAFHFDLAQDADLNVDVYDAAGRRIQSLFAGRRGAGSHTFRWEGTDDRGQRVANGIYFVRVRAGAESLTGRVALLAR